MHKSKTEERHIPNYRLDFTVRVSLSAGSSTFQVVVSGPIKCKFFLENSLCTWTPSSIPLNKTQFPQGLDHTSNGTLTLQIFCYASPNLVIGWLNIIVGALEVSIFRYHRFLLQNLLSKHPRSKCSTRIDLGTKNHKEIRNIFCLLFCHENPLQYVWN